MAEDMKPVYISAELHSELLIAKQILGESMPRIITEGVRHRLKPIQNKIERIRAEMAKED